MRYVLATAVLLGATELLAPPVAAQEAAECLPADLLLTITIKAPDRQLESIRGFLDARASAGDAVRSAIGSNPGLVRTQVFLAGVAATAGTDAWSGPGAILGRELVLGIQPREGAKPALIASSVARDDDLRQRMLDTLHASAGVTMNGAPVQGASFEVNGVAVLRVGELLECRIGQVLLVANDRDLLERAIAAQAAKSDRLCDDATYRAAKSRIPGHAVAWARLHMPTVRTWVEAQPADTPNRIGQPLNGLLFGGWSHALAQAEDAVAWLEPSDSALDLHVDASIDDLDPAFDGFMAPPVARAPPVRIDDAVAMLLVERAWADLIGERERFLSLGASSQVANFTATLTALMGGLDFAEDVLAHVSGPVQLVVRAAKPPAGFTPSPRVPAFALIAPINLEGAPDLARRLTSGALSLGSIVSMDQAQKGSESYLVDVEEYRGHRLVSMSLPSPQAADGAVAPVVDVRYNFAPVAGVFEDRFVIASTRDIAVHIADAVLDGARLPVESQDVVSVDATRVASAFRDARAALVAQRMIKEDQTHADAARDIDAILALVDLLRGAQIEATVVPDRAAAQARLSFAPVDAGTSP